MNSDQKQELTQIRNNILGELKKIDSLIDPGKPIENLKLVRKDDHFEVTFARNTNKPIDIQFSFANGKWHSVVDMMHQPDYNPAAPASPYRFGNPNNIDEAVTVIVGTGERINGWFNFDFTQSVGLPAVEENQEDEDSNVPIEKIDLFTFFWYDNSVPGSKLKDLMTAGHHASPNKQPLKRIVENGRKAIPYLGAEVDESDEELRKRVRVRTNGFADVGWENIEFIILKDEPYPKGYTVSQLEALVDEAQKEYKVPVTFSFTRHGATDEVLPKNLELVGVNYYPFYEADAPEGYMQIWTYEDFAAKADEFMENIRQQLPGANVVITAQVFWTISGDGNPWRKPTPEEIEWYFRYASENRDVVGIGLWREATIGKWAGIGDAPELQEALIEIIDKYVKH